MSRKEKSKRMQPGNFARHIAGNIIQWTLSTYGATMGVAVLIGNGETPIEKFGNAITAVPDLLQNARRIQYAIEHRDTITEVAKYMHERVPTTEALNTTVTQTRETLEQIAIANHHLTQAYDNLTSHTWQPLDTINHISQGITALPSARELQHVAQASEHTATILQYLGHIELDPIYRAAINFLDNIAIDERGWTIGIATGVVAGAHLASTYIGTIWTRRGKPGILTQAVQRQGVQMHRQYYEENIEAVLKQFGLEEIARKHYQTKERE